MALNWVCHPVGKTPQFLTSEDLQAVPSRKLDEYFSSVKLIFSVRTSDIQSEIREQIKLCPASQFTNLLESSLSLGFMDTGWTDDYFHAAEEVSERMGGYPRACLSEWRKLREVRSNQMDVDSATSSYLFPNISGNSTATVSSDSQQSGFRFMDLPDEIRSQVIHLLFIRGELYVGDWSCDVKPKGFFRRTEYDVYDRQAHRLRRTSYAVRDLANTAPFEFNLMLVNKKLSSEIASVFYGKNTFKFLGTAESALAFFHDHASRLLSIRKVSMRFSTSPEVRFQGCYNTTCGLGRAPISFIGTWRRICNLFVHISLGLEDFELILDDGFWRNVPNWMAGAESVFNTPRLCERQGQTIGDGHQIEERNFLQHVARFAGVNIRVNIEGPRSDAEQEVFRKNLERLIQKKTFGRSYLADGNIPQCTCNRRYLKESCVWDRFGKTRRG